MRILVLEEHQRMAHALKRGLESGGYSVDVVADPSQGDQKARTSSYAVIVFDLMLTGTDGLALLRDWRRGGVSSPVVILGERNRSEDRVRCLDLGADAYLVKPFQMEELLARLRALLRRSVPRRDAGVLRVHDLEIQSPSREVRRRGQTIPLTPREFALLELLAAQPGRVVTRSMICAHLYGGAVSASNVVDVYIRYLRSKIDKGFADPLILTRWGHGYLLRGETG